MGTLTELGTKTQVAMDMDVTKMEEECIVQV